MKKLWKFALIVAGVLIAALAAGCSTEETEGLTLAKVRSAYSNIAQATKVEESIEIKSDALVQYSEERVYTLEGTEYTVTGATHTMNVLGSEKAYTDVEIEQYSVSKAEAFTGTIALEDINIESVTANAGALTVTVKAGKESDFFKLQELSGVTDMKAEFTVTGAVLDGIVVTYTAGASSVTVALNFSY